MPSNTSGARGRLAGIIRRLRRVAGRPTDGASPVTDDERSARDSARKYWAREVAEEKRRRGTPDKPKR